MSLATDRYPHTPNIPSKIALEVNLVIPILWTVEPILATDLGALKLVPVLVFRREPTFSGSFTGVDSRDDKGEVFCVIVELLCLL